MTIRKLLTAAPKVDIYEEMKKLGFKENQSGSGSRGFYFINNYVPIKSISKQNWSGSIDVHVDADSNPTRYSCQGLIKGPNGVSIKLDSKEFKDPAELIQFIVSKLKGE